MNSLTTYINTNILLMSALSCMTLTDTELLSLSSRQTYNDAIIPSINTPVNPINIYTNYSIKDIPISTETIHVNIPEHEDFEIINSFANKMLTEATSIWLFCCIHIRIFWAALAMEASRATRRVSSIWPQ